MRSPSFARRPALAFLILALVSTACQISQPPRAAPTAVLPHRTEAPATAATAAATGTAISTPIPRITETAAPTASLTAERAPTEPLPTATQPPAFSGIQYEYEGIRLDVPGAVASAVTASLDPAGWGDATIIGKFGPRPDMIVFEFTGYPKTERASDPQIKVFPAREYEAVNAPAQTQREMLEDILTTGVPLEDFEPFLPLANAWENFTAQDALLLFANGKGLRYLTAMNQYNQPQGRIDSDSLFYTYQGLTGDGTLYISAVLPVQLPILDTPERENTYRAAFGDNQKLRAYAEDSARLIEAAAPEDFVPSLTALDSMMQSLFVQPRITLKQPILPNYAKNCGAPASHLRPGIRARVTFTDGMPLNVRANSGKQSAIVAKLKEGSSMYIVQGPNCKDHGLWWKIESDAISGYVLESDGKAYFVEPFEE